MARIYVFDVNETLLDLHALDPLFAETFGDASARREWFAQMLQLAFVSTITNEYRDFGTLGAAALEMLAGRRGVSLSRERQANLLGGLRRLPPHPEVSASLQRLREAGLRLVSLTNSTLAVSQEQLAYAGLESFFERQFSADTVRRLKPAPEPYQMVARELGVPQASLCLVAAHTWDIAGAIKAGCSAAFIARPGMVLDPSAARPTFVGADLAEIVDQLLVEESK
ncbi:haloacid dehalogenase [Reticulibacter mediterranei]|uniref:Haloacid dehalogenase n=1 Tax=Reticulibacter mediterranei TaxID=2778369 RepID=A0A8J3IZG6_9CHLR|nr:haloacid dehalogenase type II [Reticulibacter mediterranei]GHO99615.1 haloacid dehalogenase [Reticulibacter mediterranei]